MNRTLSPQLTRTLALVGVLLLAGGGVFALLGLRTHKVSAPPIVTRSTPPARTTTTAPTPAKTATTPSTRHTTKPAATPAKPATSHAKPATTHAKPAARQAATRGNLVDARLPAPLQWALSQHRIVVVSFYDPNADVDAISVAEAHAGAVDAGVGFLLVNVLDDKVAGPLTGLLPGGGLLPNPGVLVYRAPGRVVYRFDGFADRQTVAQAAASAKAGETAPTVTDPGLAASATAATP